MTPDPCAISIIVCVLAMFCFWYFTDIFAIIDSLLWVFVTYLNEDWSEVLYLRLTDNFTTDEVNNFIQNSFNQPEQTSHYRQRTGYVYETSYAALCWQNLTSHELERKLPFSFTGPWFWFWKLVGSTCRYRRHANNMNHQVPSNGAINSGSSS